MKLYAIDPGTEQSALVKIAHDGAITGGICANAELLTALLSKDYTGVNAHLVIEKVESYGMAVGREVFDTVFWSGRFAQAWAMPLVSWSMLPRREVKLHLCGSMRAKDSNIRQALIDRYGGKPATKKGGPLHGISSHMWAALALAVTYQDQQTLRGGDQHAETAIR